MKEKKDITPPEKKEVSEDNKKKAELIETHQANEKEKEDLPEKVTTVDKDIVLPVPEKLKERSKKSDAEGDVYTEVSVPLPKPALAQKQPTSSEVFTEAKVALPTPSKADDAASIKESAERMADVLKVPGPKIVRVVASAADININIVIPPDGAKDVVAENPEKAKEVSASFSLPVNNVLPPDVSASHAIAIAETEAPSMHQTAYRTLALTLASRWAIDSSDEEDDMEEIQTGKFEDPTMKQLPSIQTSDVESLKQVRSPVKVPSFGSAKQLMVSKRSANAPYLRRRNTAPMRGKDKEKRRSLPLEDPESSGIVNGAEDVSTGNSADRLHPLDEQKGFNDNLRLKTVSSDAIYDEACLRVTSSKKRPLSDSLYPKSILRKSPACFEASRLKETKMSDGFDRLAPDVFNKELEQRTPNPLSLSTCNTISSSQMKEELGAKSTDGPATAASEVNIKMCIASDVYKETESEIQKGATCDIIQSQALSDEMLKRVEAETVNSACRNQETDFVLKKGDEVLDIIKIGTIQQTGTDQNVVYLEKLDETASAQLEPKTTDNAKQATEKQKEKDERSQDEKKMPKEKQEQCHEEREKNILDLKDSYTMENQKEEEGKQEKTSKVKDLTMKSTCVSEEHVSQEKSITESKSFGEKELQTKQSERVDSENKQGLQYVPTTHADDLELGESNSKAKDILNDGYKEQEAADSKHDKGSDDINNYNNIAALKNTVEEKSLVSKSEGILNVNNQEETESVKKRVSDLRKEDETTVFKQGTFLNSVEIEQRKIDVKNERFVSDNKEKEITDVKFVESVNSAGYKINQEGGDVSEDSSTEHKDQDLKSDKAKFKELKDTPDTKQEFKDFKSIIESDASKQYKIVEKDTEKKPDTKLESESSTSEESSTETDSLEKAKPVPKVISSPSVSHIPRPVTSHSSSFSRTGEQLQKYDRDVKRQEKTDGNAQNRKSEQKVFPVHTVSQVQPRIAIFKATGSSPSKETTQKRTQARSTAQVQHIRASLEKVAASKSNPGSPQRTIVHSKIVLPWSPPVRTGVSSPLPLSESHLKDSISGSSSSSTVPQHTSQLLKPTAAVLSTSRIKAKEAQRPASELINTSSTSVKEKATLLQPTTTPVVKQVESSTKEVESDESDELDDESSESTTSSLKVKPFPVVKEVVAVRTSEISHVVQPVKSSASPHKVQGFGDKLTGPVGSDSCAGVKAEAGIGSDQHVLTPGADTFNRKLDNNKDSLDVKVKQLTASAQLNHVETLLELPQQQELGQKQLGEEKPGLELTHTVVGQNSPSEMHAECKQVQKQQVVSETMCSNSVHSGDNVSKVVVSSGVGNTCSKPVISSSKQSTATKLLSKTEPSSSESSDSEIAGLLMHKKYGGIPAVPPRAAPPLATRRGHATKGLDAKHLHLKLHHTPKQADSHSDRDYTPPLHTPELFSPEEPKGLLHRTVQQHPLESLDAGSPELSQPQLVAYDSQLSLLSGYSVEEETQSGMTPRPPSRDAPKTGCIRWVKSMCLSTFCFQ